jgi:hypothetical protein
VTRCPDYKRSDNPRQPPTLRCRMSLAHATTCARTPFFQHFELELKARADFSRRFMFIVVVATSVATSRQPRRSSKSSFTLRLESAKPWPSVVQIGPFRWIARLLAKKSPENRTVTGFNLIFFAFASESPCLFGETTRQVRRRGAKVKASEFRFRRGSRLRPRWLPLCSIVYKLARQRASARRSYVAGYRLSRLMSAGRGR